MSKAYHLLKCASYNKSGPIKVDEVKEWLKVLTLKNKQSIGIDSLPKLAVGVSGGADSILLAYLLNLALGNNKVHGLIVDHNLRENSFKEAELTYERLTQQSIDSTLLRIVWEENNNNSIKKLINTDFGKDYYPGVIQPTGAKLETEARMIRFELLAHEMNSQNIPIISVGHHGNDNIETAIYRFTRESGISGLSGIAPLREYPIHVQPIGNSKPYPLKTVFRPMLYVNKQRIYETCKYYGLKWVEDPTNHMTTSVHQRSIIRNILSKIETDTNEHLQPLKYDNLQKWLDHSIQHNQIIQNKVGEVLKTSIYVRKEFGLVQLDIPNEKNKSSWFNNTFLAVRILSKLSQWACCSEYPPRLSHVLRAYDQMRYKEGKGIKHAKTNQYCLQIGGALVISPTKKNPFWTITRDPLSHQQVKEHTYELKVVEVDSGSDDIKLLPVVNTTWYHRFIINLKAKKNYLKESSLLKWSRCFLPYLQHLPSDAKIIIRPINQELLNDFKQKRIVYENQFDVSFISQLKKCSFQVHRFQQALTIASSRNTIPVICIRFDLNKVKEFSNMDNLNFKKEYLDVPIAFPTFKDGNVFSNVFDVNCEDRFQKLF